ncbi:MAG: response regulator [Verrucomicrobiota bacterium]
MSGTLSDREKKAIGDRETILVIDDEMALRETMRMFLGSDFRVLVAESVDEGLARMKENQPGLILLDLNMPEKDGFQGLREIKPAYPDIPVLILTGYADRRMEESALELGAETVLRKPFDLQEMLKVLKQHFVAAS